MLKMNYRRLLIILLGTIGAISFVSSFAFYQHLVQVSPNVSTVWSAQICQLNEHGYYFYVTRQQYLVFLVLLAGGLGLVALAALLNLRWKVIRNLTREGWRLPT